MPAEPVTGQLTICPTCLRSLVLDSEAIRLATSADTLSLSDRELAALRHARKKYREAGL